jgi:S-formylglutathione hydrolase FrmB
MEISIFDYIRNASDETLMEMAKLTQTEQHKREAQKEEAKNKYYSFSGSWSWGCWATSYDEALQRFEDEAYPEMLDIDYDHPEVEVDDY